jgi:hypothetical protein
MGKDNLIDPIAAVVPAEYQEKLLEAVNKEISVRVSAALSIGYRAGYTEALKDFGIWKNGVQHIGCLETPIKEVLAKKFGEGEKNEP